ncbi:hypothetical protein FQZ97_554350 [compost metagenome]
MAVHYALAGASETSTVSATRPYAWVVAAQSFALLLCGYSSRQVLNAVFPQLKTAWAPNDAQLGPLSGSNAALVFCYGKKRRPTVAGVRPVRGMS